MPAVRDDAHDADLAASLAGYTRACELQRYWEHRAANIAAGLHDPAIRGLVLERLPAGLLQQVAVEALGMLQQRAEREPWVSELVEEVAASIGFAGLRRWRP